MTPIDPLDHAWWLASRASGIVALAAMAFSVVLGLSLGGKLVPGHVPVRGRFVVEKLAQGPFAFTGPMLRGNTGDLGKVVIELK